MVTDPRAPGAGFVTTDFLFTAPRSFTRPTAPPALSRLAIDRATAIQFAPHVAYRWADSVCSSTCILDTRPASFGQGAFAAYPQSLRSLRYSTTP